LKITSASRIFATRASCRSPLEEKFELLAEQFVLDLQGRERLLKIVSQLRDEGARLVQRGDLIGERGVNNRATNAPPKGNVFFRLKQ